MIAAQDLMVGDWVYRVDFKEHIPVRILGLEVVNYVTHPKQYVADVFCPKHNNNVGLYMDEICPIPITAEILEKNFSSTPDWYFIGMNKYCFRIYKYKDKWDFCFSRDGKGTRLYLKISNVHELQHALRLCGIDKEIKL